RRLRRLRADADLTSSGCRYWLAVGLGGTFGLLISPSLWASAMIARARAASMCTTDWVPTRPVVPGRTTFWASRTRTWLTVKARSRISENFREVWRFANPDANQVSIRLWSLPNSLSN